MIKLGMLDFDTSHVVQFARRLNHVGIDKEQWVDGATVVLGCPGESKISPERIPGFTKAVKEIGVELVEKIPAFAKSDKTYASQFVNALHAAGVMTVPAGNQVIRLLPALNLKKSEADEGLQIIEQVVAGLAS